MVIYSQKNQTQINFLSKETNQCHMQNDYILPEVKFRTIEFPSTIKLTKTWTCYKKQKSTYLWWNTEVISWVKWRQYLLKITLVIFMKVFNESQSQTEITMLSSNKVILITCSGKNSCRKGPSSMMPSPSGSNLVFMRFTLR